MKAHLEAPARGTTPHRAPQALPNDDPHYLTTTEAATYLRYRTRGGVLMAVRRGLLRPAGRRGRSLLFARVDLDAMIRAPARACAAEVEHKHEQKNGTRWDFTSHGFRRSLTCYATPRWIQWSQPRSQAMKPSACAGSTPRSAKAKPWKPANGWPS